MKLPIEIDKSKIESFCKKWKIVELSFFGSVLRDDFRPDSDVDVLVTFAPGADRTLWDFLDAQDELKEIFGREISFVERKSVETSRNYIRRNQILRTAELFYASR